MTKILKYEEITENLCAYDERNPDYFRPEMYSKEEWDGIGSRRSTCSCDNCFYGRTPLANMLILLLEGLSRAI